MPDPTQPILRRLGDIKLGDDVSITSDGITFIATVDRYNDDGSIDLRMNCGEMADYVHYSQFTACHRLIPETALTKHAGEMHKLLLRRGRFLGASRVVSKDNPDARDLAMLDTMMRECFQIDRDIESLLSRIAADAKGGA